MQQTILAEKSAVYQQEIKERDQLFVQLQRQNLSLKASMRDMNQERSRLFQLLQLCVGLLLGAGIAVPNEVTEHLGSNK